MENFTCPSCGNKIEKKHAFLLNNFSVITCSKCNSRLVPEFRKTAGVGAKFGAIGGLIGFTIPTVAIIYRQPIIGISITLFLAAVIYIIVVNKTYRYIRFKLKE